MRAFLSAPKVRHLVLVMGLAGLSSLAHAAVVAQATASVSNFGFAVKDLDPADGIAASFTVQHPWSYDASTSVLKYQDSPSAGLSIVESDNSYDRRAGSASVNVFNPKPLASDLPSGGGHSEITKGGVSASVTLNSDEFAGAKYGWYRYGNWTNDYAGGLFVGGPEVLAISNSGFENWVLSPGSEVTISGTIRLDASVNAVALTDQISDHPVLAAALVAAHPNFYSNYGEFGSGVEVIKNLPGDQARVELRAQEIASGAQGSWGQEHAHSWLEQSFSYTIRNHLDTSIDMSFGLQVVARAGAAPIPEPSSWALLLVGLSSMGAASAWRRRTGSK